MQEEYISRFQDGTLVRWLPLTWKQYKDLTQQFGENPTGAAEYLLHEAACHFCVVDQEQDGVSVPFQELYAGTVSIVGYHILSTTGFIPTVDKVQEHLNVARAKIQDDWYQSAKAVICGTFHKDPDEIEEWHLSKFMHYVAIIELTTGQKIDVVSDEEDNQKYIMKDGKKIPVLTKDQATRSKKIDLDNGYGFEK